MNLHYPNREGIDPPAFLVWNILAGAGWLYIELVCWVFRHIKVEFIR